MQVRRLDYREFEKGVAAAVVAAPAARSFVPTGKRKEGAPPPPSFTEEQVKAAERDGYQKGFLEGTQEGRKQAESEQAAVDRQLSETVEKFAASIGPLFTDYRRMVLEMKQVLPKAAFAMAKKVAGEALEKNAAAVVDDVALRCAESMAGEPKLAITVHESLAATLEKKFKDMAAGQPDAAAVTILRDAQMATSDCRIEWQQGGLKRDTAQLWQQVEKAVESLSATGLREGQAQMEHLQESNPAYRASDSAVSKPTLNQDTAQPIPGSQDLKKE